MRTTVTLDADVESLLRESMQRSRKSFKQALNDALRRALKGDSESEMPPFKIDARPMGIRTGIDPARLQEFADEAEVDEFLRKTEALSHQRT